MITLLTKVKAVKRHERLKSAWKKDPQDPKSEVVEVYEDLGWAILLEGLTSWLFVGGEEPPLRENEDVTVTIASRRKE